MSGVLALSTGDTAGKYPAIIPVLVDLFPSGGKKEAERVSEINKQISVNKIAE